MGEHLATPEAILTSAATLLREMPFDDIAYRSLGESVGVSERTVYRHFPTRPHLLSALARWLEDQVLPPPTFTDWESFLHVVETRFSDFDRAPSYAHLMARAEAISPVGPDHSSFFAEAVRALVSTVAPGLARRDAGRLCAGLVNVASAQFWARCRTGLDMDVEGTSAAFRRIAEQLRASFPETAFASHRAAEAAP
ncbi:TetR/AcrR family transcriptional regulator [Nesterenkonia xinjiangensis]|uniref:AcrR family transcriptional regulator n=1 Tax=Nesterenkonia xinjiangensis TaxID=225327 RepID=A0A7Z0GJS0_9MICC|nr:TetR/AcrR family transcriptional regulator [Nesterenkonia xinjiangensis]NYJ77232.1 AcrR family transcriptional regulator [Nesterenkonia xinjiangensis]